MKIDYRTGDLLAAQEPAIVHGCNAQGVMGSGVAKAIRERYPRAYERYSVRHKARGLALGMIIPANCGTHVVYNAITQRYYGRDGKRYVDYDAIRTVFRKLNDVARDSQTPEGHARAYGHRIEAIAMPLIGAGLAGGSWATISAIIEEEATAFQPVVYLIDGKVPTS